MSRAVVTFGVGREAEALLELSVPTMQYFADLHGWDLLVATPQLARPASWHKVEALLDALESYDEALWLDADTVIVDPLDDLEVPEEAWQALVVHRTADGEVPNCGVWFVRRPMIPTLELVWSMTEYLQHGWWEQRAVVELLGYDGHPLRRVRETELHERTFELDAGWNVHCRDSTPTDRPRIMHATMHADRSAIMAEWSAARMQPATAE